MDQLVRWSRRVRSADEAAAAVTEAFGSFTGGRPRPVHIEVPFDVLEQSWSGEATECTKVAAPQADPAAVRRAAEVLAAAAQPMIIAGGGAVDAQAEADRAGRGARRAGRHHGQRQRRGRRGAPAVGRRIDPAARRAEGRRRQRRAAGGRHRVGRFGPVGGTDSRQDRHPLRHRSGPAEQELPCRSRAAWRRRRRPVAALSARAARAGASSGHRAGCRVAAMRAATRP